MLARASVPVQTEAAAAASAAKQVSQLQEKAPAQEPKVAKQMESSPAAVVGNLSNVSLQFRVDEKTKDVTVFVVDKDSKRVLRSIPATELAKLQAGDLLKLTA